MPYACALSTAEQSARAVAEVCERAGGELGGPPDLAVMFFSPHHLAEKGADVIARAVAERLKPRAMLGTVAEAVIGNDREVEDGPAVSLWLARWPGEVRLVPFH